MDTFFKALKGLPSGLVVLFFTFLVNTAVNYYSSEKGTLSVSKPILIEGRSVVVVTIENFTRDFFDEVSLEIPSTIKIESISSDSPVQITSVGKSVSANAALLKIEKIPPRLATRLLIPTSRSAETSGIRILNAESLGLLVRRDGELDSPLRKSLFLAAVTSCLYLLFVMVLGYHMKTMMREIQAKADQIQIRMDATEKRMRRVESAAAKGRLLLLGRVHDYSKELEFWRGCIRSMLAERSAPSKTYEEVVELVTRSLKTYGARFNAIDFEAVKVASAWVRDFVPIDTSDKNGRTG